MERNLRKEVSSICAINQRSPSERADFYFLFRCINLIRVIQETKNQGFLITFTKKLHLACFLAKHALDFVLQRLLGGLNEMDMDDISGLADFSSDCWLSGSHLVLMCL